MGTSAAYEQAKAEEFPEVFGEQDFRFLLLASFSAAAAIFVSALLVSSGPVTLTASAVNTGVFALLLSVHRQISLFRAKLLAIAAMWVTAVVVIASSQGIRDSALLLFPGVLLYGSITFDRRVYWTVAAASAAAIAVLGLAEKWGYFNTGFPMQGLSTDIVAAVVILSFVALFIDVYLTNLRRSMLELTCSKLAIEKADRTKSEFLTIVTHELRSPLNPIIGYAQMLGSEVQDPEHREALGEINASGRQLLELIDSVLDYSRVADGSIPLQAEDVPICDLCEELGAYTQTLSDAQSCAVELVCPACRSQHLKHASVRLDRGRTLQILKQMLLSAVDLSRNGTIRVHCDLPTAGVAQAPCRFVMESSTSLPEGMTENLFEPLWAAQSGEGVNRRRHTGLGLGLATARQLARLMDGDVSCDQKADGGTRFILEVPTLA
ncbi:MAG: sensor histidine kinase [Opitutales bacterium]